MKKTEFFNQEQYRTRERKEFEKHDPVQNAVSRVNNYFCLSFAVCFVFHGYRRRIESFDTGYSDRLSSKLQFQGDSPVPLEEVAPS